MKTSGVLEEFDMRVAHRPKAQGDRRGERASDCWPDWADAGDPALAEESARKNAPGIVFGEIGRVLLVILAVIAVIQITLDMLRIS